MAANAIRYLARPGSLQMKLHQNLEELSRTFATADDILITAQGETVHEAVADHDRNLAKFLSHCKVKHQIGEGEIQLNIRKTIHGTLPYQRRFKDRPTES